MLDLAMTLPEITCQTSENMFYSSFLALCQIKGIEFEELQNNIIESQISDLNTVLALK